MSNNIHLIIWLLSASLVTIGSLYIRSFIVINKYKRRVENRERVIHSIIMSLPALMVRNFREKDYEPNEDKRKTIITDEAFRFNSHLEIEHNKLKTFIFISGEHKIKYISRLWRFARELRKSGINIVLTFLEKDHYYDLSIKE